jgi:hypothetical protein
MEQWAERIEQGGANTVMIYIGFRCQASVSNFSLLRHQTPEITIS